MKKKDVSDSNIIRGDEEDQEDSCVLQEETGSLLTTRLNKSEKKKNVTKQIGKVGMLTNMQSSIVTSSKIKTKEAKTISE